MPAAPLGRLAPQGELARFGYQQASARAHVLDGKGAGCPIAWLNRVGQISVTAGVDSGCANFLMHMSPKKPATTPSAPSPLSALPPNGVVGAAMVGIIAALAIRYWLYARAAFAGPHVLLAALEASHT